ncbi:MAG: dienelactone hydrolase family protein [Hyphomicrobiales bacterium]|nr:dienelactone hydrolase family protein [Hyphomicrobiales bacterium]
MNIALSRRDVVKGLVVGGVPATATLAAVLANPMLARAAAAGLETVTITTEGGKSVSAALALPAATPAPAVLLIHEWWGLNDQIKSVAAELAKQGYVALAVDLYGGKVAGTPDDARAYTQMVGKDPDTAVDTLRSWLRWLKKNEKVNGKLGTVGWCFGGGWSLNASMAEPVDATVVYYGKVDQPADRLARLKGPVQGHFATQDQWINKAMVGKFEAAMAEAKKPYQNYWYDANHAFANPTQSRYDAADAELAWTRTLDFFKQHLG